jgi:hypothetical protein
MKTWKKIEETRRRATEVSRLKQINNERQNAKLQAARQEQQRQQEHRQHILRMRDEREKEKNKIKDAIIMHK